MRLPLAGPPAHGPETQGLDAYSWLKIYVLQTLVAGSAPKTIAVDHVSVAVVGV